VVGNRCGHCKSGVQKLLVKRIAAAGEEATESLVPDEEKKSRKAQVKFKGRTSCGHSITGIANLQRQRPAQRGRRQSGESRKNRCRGKIDALQHKQVHRTLTGTASRMGSIGKTLGPGEKRWRGGKMGYRDLIDTQRVDVSLSNKK